VYRTRSNILNFVLLQRKGSKTFAASLWQLNMEL
jgi:hypothetical protein